MLNEAEEDSVPGFGFVIDEAVDRDGDDLRRQIEQHDARGHRGDGGEVTRPLTGGPAPQG